MESYKCFGHVGMAVDPIHVGTGGARIGRVDLSIVRDPATRLPKIPGSSLAGTYRAYSAMAENKYPQCAGLGLRHCGRPDCPICTVYGFSKGQGSGFAGLAAFSDAQILLFPVPTRKGVKWVTCPSALRLVSIEIDLEDQGTLYLDEKQNSLNVGWLLLPVSQNEHLKQNMDKLKSFEIPQYVQTQIGVVSDYLFTHIVNSNLEVRTSVAINPVTGAAEDKALFTYEALPRTTFLYWDVICKNPQHFRVNEQKIQLNGKEASVEDVHSVVQKAHDFFEHLGIGGMGTRGMGRLRVLNNS